jgi:hypothetical protein
LDDEFALLLEARQLTLDILKAGAARQKIKDLRCSPWLLARASKAARAKTVLSRAAKFPEIMVEVNGKANQGGWAETGGDGEKKDGSDANTGVGPAGRTRGAGTGRNPGGYRHQGLQYMRRRPPYL